MICELTLNGTLKETLLLTSLQKGMVVVGGAVVKEASSAEELMSLFESGSASRHVASTKMNAESSRSHLVLSIVIESTNLTSGAVVKGKVKTNFHLHVFFIVRRPDSSVCRSPV